MTTVADLRHILDLGDPLKHSPCIGYGQRNPDCRNPVASASRSQAEQVLNTIVRFWRAHDNVDDELHQLASLLLCKRNPQWQAEAKVEEWKRKMKKAGKRSAEANGSRASSRTSTPSSTRSSRSSTTHADSESVARSSKVPKSLTNKELLKELRRRLLDTADQMILDHFLKLADEVNDTFKKEDDSEDDSEDDADSSDDNSDASDDADNDHESDNDSNELQNVQAAARAPRQTPSQPSASTSAVARAHHRPSAEALRQARVAALSTTPGSTKSMVHGGPSSPLRQSHVECVVCLQPYDGDDQEPFWQCDACLIRVHRECFDAW
ncbi:hypothetical protein LTR70_005179 [Exophiala xenobiotica]|uniref:RING-type domain-containing protein n=1 Tax=Lithohypha guttulata TaxID=1690604 RepID=A0ABR0KBJ8_9EURO|nr:hypothetical protein LTR24_004753 [Lithohypha guttulata]KAK5318883.1 hypothetical protein LTR70_005179 [Exophiala xenobiotica]